MAQIEYGEGFGVTYVPEAAVEDRSNSVRREKVVTTRLGDDVVTVVIRDTITEWDPYLNMVRAAVYPWLIAQRGSGLPFFPVPPVSRRIKDALVKTTAARI